jgi:uncharacterized protein (DUF2336 family)
MALPAAHSSTAGVERLVARVHARNALAPTPVLSSLCVCDLNFFQNAMAAMAEIAAKNAEALIFDAGPAGLKTIYSASGLPREMFFAFRTAVDVIREAGRDMGSKRPLEITQEILIRLRIECEPVCAKSDEHTLSYLWRLVATRSQRLAEGSA